MRLAADPLSAEQSDADQGHDEAEMEHAVANGLADQCRGNGDDHHADDEPYAAASVDEIAPDSCCERHQHRRDDHDLIGSRRAELLQSFTSCCPSTYSKPGQGGDDANSCEEDQSIRSLATGTNASAARPAPMGRAMFDQSCADSDQLGSVSPANLNTAAELGEWRDEQLDRGETGQG